MRIYDQADKGMHLVSRAGKANWNRPECAPVEGTLSGAAFTTRKPAVIDDYAAFPSADQALVALGVRSITSVPIKADKWAVGVVNLASTEPSHFPPKLVNLLSGIADGLAAL